jgi:endonuclease III
MPLPRKSRRRDSDSDADTYGARRMNQAKRLALFQRFQAANPAPKTELHYSSPFELLIAVILSAQATDVSVNKATGPLFASANTPNAIAALGEQALRGFIKSIGLFQTKAKNVIATCERLIALHDGAVPQDRAALEALPGVGRKTANVVLNTAFGWETMAVDTHIFRLANRLGLAPAKTVLGVEQALLKHIPKPFLRDAHHWLILHGRYICKARSPQCKGCLVADLCGWKAKPADVSAPDA